ncbi:transcriptional regulator GcvA [Caenispirillum bisanense]|uniref:Transcriptional regulator, LysR family n=1 Tax=Caenispirillum bisanense TaxID=414052 RepID=A0A286GHM1_9PROT|nr:transcriptional regulator GcvA [Caenispirillum bisanense]SOD94982.1 transcriptional regulator, LysR family [Caenispirillum bisanense]
MRLPPLNALRVFEAAARHLSFTKAAEELHVTQAAVSQQVRGLEEQLGVPLFRRLNRALLLTDTGQRYAVAVRGALEQIAEATAALRPAREDDGSMTVSVMPSFAHKWLMPRLGRFLDRHPEISLRVHASFEAVDFDRDRIDCALRQGTGGYDGLYSELLLAEEVTPMCAPAVAARLHDPRDLLRETLLYDYGADWQDWLAAAGVTGGTLPKGTEFFDSSMALQVAMDARGVVLGRTGLAADDLASGRLVAPFPVRLPYAYATWFVCPRGTEDHPKIKAFRDWLREECAAFGSAAPPVPLPHVPLRSFFPGDDR